MILLAGDQYYLVFNQIKTAEALVPCLETFITRTRQTAARLSIQSDAVYFVAILITLGKILRTRQTGVQRAVHAHGFRQKPVDHSATATTQLLWSRKRIFPWLGTSAHVRRECERNRAWNPRTDRQAARQVHLGKQLDYYGRIARRPSGKWPTQLENKHRKYLFFFPMRLNPRNHRDFLSSKRFASLGTQSSG